MSIVCGTLSTRTAALGIKRALTDVHLHFKYQIALFFSRMMCCIWSFNLLLPCNGREA